MRKLSVLLLVMASFGAAETVEIPLRSRTQVFRSGGEAQEVLAKFGFDPSKAAVVVCDMWDNHWCGGAAKRVTQMAPRMNQVLGELRKRGMLIVHAPSDTMQFYKDYPQRQKLADAEMLTPKEVRAVEAPPLPIDDSDGGCDTDDKFYKAWTRQHPAIDIAPQDLISDKGAEIYTEMKRRGITVLFVMGVHTNMCILNRSFAIRQMTKWGVPAVLVRDLTDSMYDPRDRPHVPHDEGTELVIRHIEQYWAPTVLSRDLTAALR